MLAKETRNMGQRPPLTQDGFLKLEDRISEYLSRLGKDWTNYAVSPEPGRKEHSIQVHGPQIRIIHTAIRPIPYCEPIVPGYQTAISGFHCSQIMVVYNFFRPGHRGDLKAKVFGREKVPILLVFLDIERAPSLLTANFKSQKTAERKI
jgi:hypothetical protein